MIDFTKFYEDYYYTLWIINLVALKFIYYCKHGRYSIYYKEEKFTFTQTSYLLITK